MTNRSKQLWLILMTLCLMIVFTACGSPSGTNSPPISGADTKASGAADTKATKIYKGEEGDIQVPAQPKRIAMLTNTYAGNLLQLGVTPIAVNEYPKTNKFYEGKLDQVPVITADNVEKLIELNPDLIVTYVGDKNVNKYKQIAPTVALSYDKYDYMQQHLEMGKLLGKEAEAQAWIDGWKKKAEAAKAKVLAAVPGSTTVSVMETFGKDAYIYFRNGGRGTEILYQVFGFKAPESLKVDQAGPPYKAISSEAIPQYTGDYLFIGGDSVANSFMQTELWKNIPAVKNNRLIRFDSDSFAYNDPISLEKELDFIVKALTQGK